MLRHSSSLFYYFLSLFVRLHITIATITRIIPNISPADKVSLYSITPIKVAATGSTDAKIEAFPLSKFLRPAVYRQNASTVLKKPNFKLADKNSHASPKYPCQNYHSWCKFFHYPASLYPKRMITQQAYKYAELSSLNQTESFIIFKFDRLHIWCPDKYHRYSSFGISYEIEKTVSNRLQFSTPRVGFEPTTLRLTAECSTAELSRNIKDTFMYLQNHIQI